MLTLVYLRHNVAHAVVGQMFGVSADISERTFAEVILLLRDVCPAHRWDAEKRWTKREPSWHPDTLDLVLVDSFETPIAAPACPPCRGSSTPARRSATRSRRRSSRTNGEAIAIETGHPGPASDKTVYEQSPAAGALPARGEAADLGYQGVPEMLLPHKRKRGKAGQEAPELTPAQKDENRFAARSGCMWSTGCAG